MTGGYIALSYPELLLAAALLFVNGILSFVLQLRLERVLLIAALRSAAQLLLIGFILQWVFSQERWYVVLALLLPMTLVAGTSAVRRTERRYPGIWLIGIGSVGASSWLATGYAVLFVVRPEPWYLPQYLIPLTGLILGNSLTGISLALERFGEELSARRDEVEARLCLGATRWEAAHVPIQRSVRAGMIPMINAMTVAGIVSLPGMMTGQLLAGVEPTEAVKYQIVVMFLLASGTALGTALVVLLSFRRLFNADHQFRYDLIQRAQ